MATPAQSEFAPGIPAARVVQKLPKFKNPKIWELAVHLHQAARAGEHFDLRLGDPATGRAHSWALRQLPKPGEKRLAVQQPTHTVEYMDFTGAIPSGAYGAGQVGLAQRGKTEVLRADDNQVRFNVYRGKETEEYALRRMKGAKNWLLQNITTSRNVGAGQALPSSKPKYKTLSPEKIDVDDPNTELQAKIDGAHVLYQFKSPGSMPRVVSYRPTERATGVIEHTPKLPGFHQRRSPSALGDTILRGELYATSDSGRALPAAEVGGLLNANVWKSREKQEQLGKLKPVVFDVVRWKGQNVESAPYAEKKQMLSQAVKAAPWLSLPRIATTPEEKRRLMEDIRSGKEPSTEEGVIVWHKDKPIPTKAKFLHERDVFVRRIFPEKGEKRQGTMAGGFEFSYSKNGPVVGRVGTGMSHQMKKDLLENPSKYEGLKARIKMQRAPEKYAPRAPVFHSFHLDQDLPEDVKTASEKVASTESLKDVVYRQVGGAKPKTAEAAPAGFWKGQPTPAGTVKFKTEYQGIPISVDRPKGFIMKGTDAKGNDWVRRYKFDYGFIPKTLGGDGDGLDVFVGPLKSAKHAYWVVQRKDDGSFDEYKVFLGFPDRHAAISAYQQHIPKKYFKGVITMKVDMVRAMLGINPDGKGSFKEEKIQRRTKLAFVDELGWLLSHTV